MHDGRFGGEHGEPIFLALIVSAVNDRGAVTSPILTPTTSINDPIGLLGNLGFADEPPASTAHISAPRIAQGSERVVGVGAQCGRNAWVGQIRESEMGGIGPHGIHQAERVHAQDVNSQQLFFRRPAKVLIVNLCAFSARGAGDFARSEVSGDLLHQELAGAG